jgi:hypothetical protein
LNRGGVFDRGSAARFRDRRTRTISADERVCDEGLFASATVAYSDVHLTAGIFRVRNERRFAQIGTGVLRFLAHHAIEIFTRDHADVIVFARARAAHVHARLRTARADHDRARRLAFDDAVGNAELADRLGRNRAAARLLAFEIALEEDHVRADRGEIACGYAAADVCADYDNVHVVRSLQSEWREQRRACPTRMAEWRSRNTRARGPWGRSQVYVASEVG